MSVKRAGVASQTTAANASSPQAELLGLLVEEFTAGGLDVTLIDGDEPGVPPQLMMRIDTDRSDRHLRLHAFFLPDIDDPPVIQYFAALPYVIEPGNEAATARCICMLNSRLPLTGFEIDEAERATAFRHTHALGIRPLDPGVVAWALTMIRSAIEQFGDVLEAVGGGLDVETAVARVDQRLAEFSEV